jgi:hypothetical protein
VKYIDYSRERTNDKHVLMPFVHKRKSFAYENELRVMTFAPHGKAPRDFLAERMHTIEEGRYVRVDLLQLIERIYVSPRAASWLGELVKSIQQRFGHHSHKVTISKLCSLG